MSMPSHRKVPASKFVNQVCDVPGDKRDGTSGYCMTLSSANPEVFGPVAWSFLHTVAEHYDPTGPKSQEKCATWLANTAAMLPCTFCRGHMQKHVDATDTRAACESRDSLRTYLVDFHNKVNERTGGDAPWTPEQAKDAYGTAELCVD
jgi:hypothetical protein